MLLTFIPAICKFDEALMVGATCVPVNVGLAKGAQVAVAVAVRRKLGSVVNILLIDTDCAVLILIISFNVKLMLDV